MQEKTEQVSGLSTPGRSSTWWTCHVCDYCPDRQPGIIGNKCARNGISAGTRIVTISVRLPFSAGSESLEAGFTKNAKPFIPVDRSDRGRVRSLRR